MSETIFVQKINESLCRLKGDFYLVKNLADKFTFKPNNYQWNPKYKSGQWDGNIRMINLYQGTFPTGLLPSIVEVCESGDIEIELDERLIPESKISIENLKVFCDKLNITDKDKKITPYDYQLKAIHECIENQRITLLSPTNSGKTLIYYNILRFLLYKKLVKKILIIVPTTTLVEQIAGDFENYSSTVKWNASDHIHKVYDGAKRETNKAITIGTWQSFYKQSKKFLSQYDILIGDEAHGFEGTSLQKLSDKLIKASYRIGGTGSLKGENISTLTIEGIFGPIIETEKQKNLIKMGQSAPIEIQCIELQYSDADKKELQLLYNKNRGQGAKPFVAEKDFLINHHYRNNFLINLAKTRKGNTLVLFDKRTHGQLLFDRLEKETDKKIFYVDGTVKGSYRNEIRAIAEENDNCIIVASYKTFSTGISIKNLYHLIFASSTKSTITIMQSLGRMMRKVVDKKAQVYDVYDNLYYNKRKNYYLKHFIQRLKIYRKEEHPYKLHKVKIRSS